MSRSPSSDPESIHDVLLVHTPFNGDCGIGRIVHIEPAGPFAFARAQGNAAEFLESVSWGNVRFLNWIGAVVDAPEPQVGNFALFDESFAAPKTHVNELVKLMGQPVELLRNNKTPSIDLDMS